MKGCTLIRGGFAAGLIHTRLVDRRLLGLFVTLGDGARAFVTCYLSLAADETLGSMLQ